MKKSSVRQKFESKRFLLTVCSLIYIALMGVYAAFFQMEGLASACVAGVITILSTYVYGQTKRPSQIEEGPYNDNIPPSQQA